MKTSEIAMFLVVNQVFREVKFFMWMGGSERPRQLKVLTLSASLPTAIQSTWGNIKKRQKEAMHDFLGLPEVGWF